MLLFPFLFRQKKERMTGQCQIASDDGFRDFFSSSFVGNVDPRAQKRYYGVKALYNSGKK